MTARRGSLSKQGIAAGDDVIFTGDLSFLGDILFVPPVGKPVTVKASVGESGRVLEIQNSGGVFTAGIAFNGHVFGAIYCFSDGTQVITQDGANSEIRAGAGGAVEFITDAGTLAFKANGILSIPGTIDLQVGAGLQTQLDFAAGGFLRWRVRKTAGGNFGIEAFDATGAFIDEPFAIINAAGGAIEIKRRLEIFANTIFFRDPPSDCPIRIRKVSTGNVLALCFPSFATNTADRNFFLVTPDADTTLTLNGDFVAPTVARTTAIQSFNLTTTLADVTSLTAALKANKVYKVRAVLLASVGGGGLQAALNDPTGATDIQYVTRVFQTTGMGSIERRTAYDVGTGSSSATVIMIIIDGYIKNNATPGTLAVRAAQQMSNGVDSDILEGSTLEVQEIA